MNGRRMMIEMREVTAARAVAFVNRVRLLYPLPLRVFEGSIFFRYVRVCVCLRSLQFLEVVTVCLHDCVNGRVARV